LIFNWVDLVIICLYVLIVILETRRGFGRAIFDTIGFFGVLKVTCFLYPTLARLATLSDASHTNQAIWFALLFIITTIIFMIISRLIYGYMLISLEVFDPMLGLVCGIVIGTVVAHLFLRFLVILFTPYHVGVDLIAQSMLGEELLDFKTYHKVLNTLYHLGE